MSPISFILFVAVYRSCNYKKKTSLKCIGSLLQLI